LGGASSSIPNDCPFYFATLRPHTATDGLSSFAPSFLRHLEESLADEEPPPVEGVTLAALLGRGSFGRVHLGSYRGEAVAVKVLILDPVSLGSFPAASYLSGCIPPLKSDFKISTPRCLKN